jgi:hypothetical protein
VNVFLLDFVAEMPNAGTALAALAGLAGVFATVIQSVNTR